MLKSLLFWLFSFCGTKKSSSKLIFSLASWFAKRLAGNFEEDVIHWEPNGSTFLRQVQVVSLASQRRSKYYEIEKLIASICFCRHVFASFIARALRSETVGAKLDTLQNSDTFSGPKCEGCAGTPFHAGGSGTWLPGGTDRVLLFALL